MGGLGGLRFLQERQIGSAHEVEGFALAADRGAALLRRHAAIDEEEDQRGECVNRRSLVVVSPAKRAATQLALVGEMLNADVVGFRILGNVVMDFPGCHAATASLISLALEMDFEISASRFGWMSFPLSNWEQVPYGIPVSSLTSRSVSALSSIWARNSRIDLGRTAFIYALFISKVYRGSI